MHDALFTSEGLSGERIYDFAEDLGLDMERFRHELDEGLRADKVQEDFLFAWLTVRLGLAELPGGVTWRQLFAASCLAGIGFTISLFIAGAAFTDPALVATAKVAILIASILAALLGTVLLYLTSPSRTGTTEVVG